MRCLVTKTASFLGVVTVRQLELSHGSEFLLITCQDFADSAEDISFSIEGDGVPILRARLTNEDGEHQDADVNLSERLGNNNGEFYFA